MAYTMAFTTLTIGHLNILTITFAPILIGQDSHLVEGLRERMFRKSLLHGRVGSVMRAISIPDCALWDVNARAAWAMIR